MPQMSRYHCSRCKESIFNCLIDDKRIPLVFYMVVGQIPDAVEDLDVNAEGVKVPSFIREMMATPGGTQRIDLCIKCLAEVFGLDLVAAADDPMYDSNNDKIPDARQLAAGVGQVEAWHRLHVRPLHAIMVGQGRAQVSDLPAEYLPPPDASPAPRIPRAAVTTLSTEELEAELERRRAS